MLTKKMSKKDADRVTQHMFNALSAAFVHIADPIDFFTESHVGYVSARADMHTFDVCRVAYGKGIKQPRRDGFFIRVVRSSKGFGTCYHPVAFYAFADKDAMCKAYDYLWAARKNA